MKPYQFAHASGPAAAAACVAQLGAARPRQGLGLVYVTDQLAQDLPGTLARLRSETGIEDWVGAVGTGICATGREYFGEPGMAVMIAEVEPDDYRIFGAVRDDVGRFSVDNGAWMTQAESHFAIVHADPRNERTPGIVADLAGEMDGFLVGGLTSAQSGAAQIAGKVTEGGVSGVLLAGRIAVATALSQSCMLIGEKHEVTRADGNVIAELDGRPALEVFKEDIGELLARDLRRVSGYIFAALPVEGSDTGDYLVRNLVGIDVERQLVAVAELVERGDVVQFCRRDAAAAEQDLVEMIAGLKRRAGATPRGAVYFSCLARGPHMFGAGSAELGLIARELGRVPLVGLFCNGEISHNRLYTYTGVLTLFL